MPLYEALTNASPSDSCPFQFTFRSGDKVELSEDAAKVLIEAGAVRVISPRRPPARVEAEPRRNKRAE